MAKLEDKIVNGLEDRIVKRVVEAIAPALERMMKKPVVPTNDVDFEDMYVTPPDFEEAMPVWETPGEPIEIRARALI